MKNIVLLFVALLIVVEIGLVSIPYLYLSGGRSYQEISIPGDEFQLRGYLSQGVDPEGKWIIFVHGNRKEGQNHQLFRVVRENFPLDYSVLAIDLRGFGGSIGDGDRQFPNSIDRSEDLRTTVEYLKGNYNAQNNDIILIGHSFGAAQILKDAQRQNYLLVIPIVLGNWNDLIDSPAKIRHYIKKFQTNTGVTLESEIVFQDAAHFTTQALFADCPDSPVWFVYASNDEGWEQHESPYLSLYERCQPNVKRSEIALSDHTYGTEVTRIPELLRGIYSRYSLSFLKWRLNQILSAVGS
jgi:alpha/beta superfamily hydrolase